jgi:hypothetical protein
VTKHRVDAQLDLRHDKAAKVVGNDLAIDFVLHRGVALAPHAIPELRFDHAEHAFDIGTLVIPGHVLVFVRRVEVEHLFKQTADASGRINLEPHPADYDLRRVRK